MPAQRSPRKTSPKPETKQGETLALPARPAYIKPRQAKNVELQDSAQLSLARRLSEASDNKKRLEEELKEANKTLDVVSQELTDYMLGAGIDSFRVSGLGTFFTQTKNRPNIVDRAALIAWLDARGEGHVAGRNVHPQTLLGIVNDLLKEGQDLPPGVTNFAQPRVSFRRA